MPSLFPLLPSLFSLLSSLYGLRFVQLRLQAARIDVARRAGRERMDVHFRLARQSQEQSVGKARSIRRHFAVGPIGRRAVVHSPQLAEAADEEDRCELLDDAGLSAVSARE